MKLISQYIKESIKKLNGKTGIIVFDIDDTLLKVQLGSMYIYKHVPGSNNEIKLSTEEFAKDPDAMDPNKRSWFDYRDFHGRGSPTMPAGGEREFCSASPLQQSSEPHPRGWFPDGRHPPIRADRSHRYRPIARQPLLHGLGCLQTSRW